MDFRTFQHATEDHEKVLSALRFVSGTGEVREKRAEGYHGNPIVVLEASIGRRGEVEAFWGRVLDAGLGPGVEENLQERISGEGELFIRFDKQEAVLGKLKLSSGEDVVAARGRVMTEVRGQEVRADRDTAEVVVRRFLNEPRLGPGARGQGPGDEGEPRRPDNLTSRPSCPEPLAPPSIALSRALI